MSRLEITLERSQNRCEPSHIISHQNCHLLLCSPLSPHSQSLPDASSQDTHTAYIRNCHKGLRGSLRVHFSLLLCSNSICHVSGLNAYISRPFGPLRTEQTELCRQTIQSHLHCSRSQGLSKNLDINYEE